MIKQSLYDITEEITTILGTDEWTDETEQQLEKLNLALEVKAGKILDFCSNLESFAEAAKTEEKRIAGNRKSVENRIKQLHSYLKRNMVAIERTELESGTRKLKIQNNPHSVVVDNEQAIPAKYFVVIPATTQLDKKAVADDLKAGKDVEGAHLEQTTRLVIK
jgi:Siphovirus Gp157